MEVRLVRAELQKCYKFEGVNHIENCKHLAERYLTMLRDNKVSSLLLVRANSRSRATRSSKSSACSLYTENTTNVAYAAVAL